MNRGNHFLLNHRSLAFAYFLGQHQNCEEFAQCSQAHLHNGKTQWKNCTQTELISTLPIKDAVFKEFFCQWECAQALKNVEWEDVKERESHGKVPTQSTLCKLQKWNKESSSDFLNFPCLTFLLWASQRFHSLWKQKEGLPANAGERFCYRVIGKHSLKCSEVWIWESFKQPFMWALEGMEMWQYHWVSESPASTLGRI